MLCCAKWLQSCLTLCDSVDCSPPGPSVHPILQARIPEWLVLSSSRYLPRTGIKPTSLMSPALAGRVFTASTTCSVVCQSLSCVQLFAAPWTVALGLSRQECRSQNSTGVLTPFRPLNVLQEIPVTVREESGFLCFHSRRYLTPQAKLECNPEIPVATGEELGVSGHKPR